MSKHSAAHLLCLVLAWALVVDMAPARRVNASSCHSDLFGNFVREHQIFVWPKTWTNRTGASWLCGIWPVHNYTKGLLLCSAQSQIIWFDGYKHTFLPSTVTFLVVGLSLLASRALRAQLAGPKSTLCFPRVCMYIYIYIYILVHPHIPRAHVTYIVTLVNFGNL